MPENNPEAQKDVSLGAAFKKSCGEIKETFVGIIKAPRAFWGLNIFDIVAMGLTYIGLLTVLGKFLSENAVVPDLYAGWMYSFLTGGITFSMLFLGGFCDKIGVRIALFLSVLLSGAGFLILSLAGTLPLGTGLHSPMFCLVVVSIIILMIGNGLMQPALYAGVKQFTNEKTAAVGYAMIYGLMNLGMFLSGLVSPFVRHRAKDMFPPNGIGGVFWVYTAMSFLTLIVVMLLLTKKAVAESTLTQINETKEESASRKKIPLKSTVLLSLVAATFAIIHFKTKNNIWYVPLIVFGTLAIWDFLKKRPEHPFRDIKFTAFIFLLIPVQTLFAHQWLTVPYYIDRVFVGTTLGNNFEFFSTLNPLLIFFLCPMVAVFTSRVSIYRMMIIGTIVMALPTFFLAVGTSPMLLMSYIVFMTIGEAMWQPRFLQFVAEIAPKGKTGVYMGVALFPWFLTKVITGLYSGWFIAKYCPKPELGLPMNPQMMWFIYGLIAVFSPIALIFTKGWIGKDMHERATAVNLACAEK